MIKELFILTVVCVAVSYAVLCDHHTCRSFECGVLRCPDDYVVKTGGGFCGCCDNCVPALKQGDTCEPYPKPGGWPYHQGVTNSEPMCDNGLKCDVSTQKCIPLPKQNVTSKPAILPAAVTVPTTVSTTASTTASTTVSS